MSKPVAVWNTCAHRVMQLTAALLFAVTLAACDGGIFGTGDGSQDLPGVDAVSAEGADDMQPTDGADMGEGASTDSDTTNTETPVDTGDPADSTLPSAANFSNTTPSGLDIQEASLPALKVINLSSLSLLASANSGAEQINQVPAPAAQTSDYLTVNTGETIVNISTTDDAAVLATLSPLNAVEDSISTLIVTDNATNNTTGTLNLTAVDTRARVSATAMAEVRIVSVRSADTSPADSIRLTPDNMNTSGVELVFPINEDDSLTSIAYALANPGGYTLSDSLGSLTPQLIELQPDTVYSLILTDNPEQAVYIEIDSRTP